MDREPSINSINHQPQKQDPVEVSVSMKVMSHLLIQSGQNLLKSSNLEVPLEIDLNLLVLSYPQQISSLLET